MIAKMTDLQKLSLDTYRGVVTNFSVAEGSNAIKNAIVEAVGGEWTYNKFMQNKYQVFAVLQEVLSIGMGTTLVDQFNGFADVQDTNLGDTTTFIVEDNSLFRVASICDGNLDIRRQKLNSSKFVIETQKLALKIYTDLDLFISGRVDFAKMIDRVTLSFASEVGNRIYSAIYGSYGSLSAPYSFSGTFTEATLAEMIAHVEAITGQVAVIYGTKKALGKVTSTTPSERMKDELNLMGHQGYFQGTALLSLPQAHKANTSEFAIADDFLLVVPNGEKIVKVVFEGDAYMYDTVEGTRNDEQKEFFFARKVGVGVLKASQYGIYKLS